MTITPSLRLDLTAVISETRHNSHHQTKLDDSTRTQIILEALHKDGYRKYTESELLIFDKEQ